MAHEHHLRTSDAARLIGVSDVRVRALDDVLKPIRVRGYRRFDRGLIELYAAARNQAKDARGK